jgi:hypothetical protein
MHAIDISVSNSLTLKCCTSLREAATSQLQCSLFFLPSLGLGDKQKKKKKGLGDFTFADGPPGW